MKLARLGSVFVVVVLTALPAIVSADIAPPRPEDLHCPAGTVATLPTIEPGTTDPRGRPLRPYPYCAPLPACTGDEACAAGQVCSPEPIGFCLEEREVAPGQTVRVPRARGCEPDGTCLNIHSTCEQVRRCVPAPEPRTAPTPDDAPQTEASETSPEADTADEAAEPAREESGGCSVSAGRSASAAWLAWVAAAALLWRRRGR